MRVKFDRHMGLVLTIGSRALWAGWFRKTKPITHPEGKAFGFWREDREAFFTFGPALVTFGPR